VNHYNKGTAHIIYQPIQKTPEHFNLYCKTVNRMTNIMVGFEEVERFCTSHFLAPNMKKLIDIGRHRGQGIICTARRTKRTNPDILFNCNHIIMYKQTRPEDVDYLADFVGQEAYRLPKLEPYRFVWWVDATGETHIMEKLPLSN
jgi:hypothetical protein